MVLGFLRRLFGKRKYIYFMELTPEELKGLPKAKRRKIAKIIGRLKGEIELLKRENERLRKRVEKIEKIKYGENKLLKELERQKKILEMKKKFKREILVLKRKVKVITYDGKIVRDGVKPFPYLYALELEEGKYGLGFNLILTDEKRKEFYRIELGLGLEQIFVDPQHLASSFKVGLVKIRLDSKGFYHQPRAFSRLKPMEGTKEYYKKLVEIQKVYEEELAKKDQIINELQNELEKSREREEMKDNKIRELEVALKLNNTRADGSQALVQQIMGKFSSIWREHLSMLIPLMDAEANRLLATKLNEVFVENFDKIAEKYGLKILEPAIEQAKKEAKTELEESLAMFKEIYPSEVKIEAGEKKVKKEETGE